MAVPTIAFDEPATAHREVVEPACPNALMTTVRA
jgi:hypothetical protein